VRGVSRRCGAAVAARGCGAAVWRGGCGAGLRCGGMARQSGVAGAVWLGRCGWGGVGDGRVGSSAMLVVGDVRSELCRRDNDV
jgi:hypothetical protein